MAEGKIVFKGLSNALANLNRSIRKIEGHSRQGMINAILLVRGETQRITPRKTGNLVNSIYTTVTGHGFVNQVQPTTKQFLGKDSAKMAADHTKAVKDSKKFQRKKNRIVGVIGFSAFYATFVHEMPTDTDWFKPEAENKFLERTIKRLKPHVLTILKESVKIR
jgi:hypothetical protein